MVAARGSKVAYKTGATIIVRTVPKAPGRQLLELGAFPSSRPVDDGRVVELDQALLLQIRDLEESLGRPPAVGNFRADNVAKSCSSPCLELLVATAG